MRNGLYSLHMHMLDGVKGRDGGVIILRDGSLIGGGPYFWSIGTYTVGRRDLEGRVHHQSAHAAAGSVRTPAVRRAGSHQRVFGDVYG